MDPRARFGREHTRQLEAAGLTPDQAQPLLDIGLDADVAVAAILDHVATSDPILTTYWIGYVTEFHQRTRDPRLVQQLVTAHTDVYMLNQVLDRAPSITNADLAIILTLGVRPIPALDWAGTGRDFAELAAAAADVPDVNADTVLYAVRAGVTTGELAWLAAHGRDLSQQAATGIGPRLARAPELERRLLLTLATISTYTPDSASAVLAALADAPWLDTLTRFILDGTPVDEAITLARADHGIETARAITVARTAGGSEQGRAS